MVERGWLPVLWGVAGGAVGTHNASVGIVFLMTVDAANGRQAQRGDRVLILVTAGAIGLGMFSG